MNITNIRQLFFASFLGIFPLTAQTDALPGRVGSEEVQWVQLGTTDLFFYMTPEKQALVDKIVDEINQENIKLTVDINDFDCFTTELSAIASKYPDPVHYQEGLPVYADPIGDQVLSSFSSSLNQLLASQLNLHLEGVSREINFVVNQDAHKFHQDQSTKQFYYLNQRDPKLPPCTIIQDLTLVDWDMSIDTLSATIMQDSLSEERFLLVLQPKESVGMLFTQSPKYLTREAHPSYLVPTIFPYHAVLSPIDRKADKTPGSSKGKRLSTVVRGVVLEEEIDELKSQATLLPLNRPVAFEDELGTGWRYPDGIVARKLETLPLKEFDQGMVFKHPDKENVEILEKDVSHLPLVQEIAGKFGIDWREVEKVRLIRLVKRDSGFSCLKEMDLPIREGSEIIAINSSEMTDDHDYFNLACDFVPENLPWIQLYAFPPEKGFQIPFEVLKKLSLTPIEEVLFRKAKTDSMRTDGLSSFDKMITKINLFIFERRK